MILYQYKITAILDSASIMIVNLFTATDMDNILEKEAYMLKLLDQGLVPEEIEFEQINKFNSNTPYFHLACEAMMYSAEFPN